MNVRMNLRALRASQWRSYALRFVLGGLFTVLTGVIAKSWGPVVGGLFLAFPVILPATTTLIAQEQRERKARHALQGAVRGRRTAALDAFGAVYGAIGMMAFAAYAWRALPGAAPLSVGAAVGAVGAVLARAAVLWLLLSLWVWSVRKGLRRRPL